jgi:asparagine synthase (glutamine-hydrolysing)
LDEDYIRGFLLFGGCPNRTPYKDIYPVPSGHAVTVSSAGMKIRRFWHLPFGDEIRYATLRRYEEHLRTLFREAVAVRLQTESPVLAEISGGLDSSSVVYMASHLIRGGAAKASHLTGVSYLWRNSLDEPFIREVESSCGIKSVHVSTDDVPLLSETQVGNAKPEILEAVNRSVAAAARGLGAKAILTGQNGDLVMGNWFDDSLHVAASLREFRIGRAFEEALAWSKILRLPVPSSPSTIAGTRRDLRCTRRFVRAKKH